MLPRINNEKVNKIIRKAIGIAWGLEPTPDEKAAIEAEGDLVTDEPS